MIISNPQEFLSNCYTHFNLGITEINHAERVEKIITGICLNMAPKNFEEVWQCLGTILTQNIFPEF